MPEPDDKPPPAPPLDITDEEWIAASQSCCGIDLSARRAKPPEPPRDDTGGSDSR